MLPLQPQHVLVLDTVASDPRCMARVTRMLPYLGGARPWVVSDAELDDFVAARHYAGKRWGERRDASDPDVIFIRARYDSEHVQRERAIRYPHLRRSFLGYDTVVFRRDGLPEWRAETGTVCQPAWELHSARGCPFRCAYCGSGDVIVLIANIEEQIAHLPEVFARAPDQAIWKWDNHSDVNCFEPEWHAVAPMIERFATETRRWLLLYTGKSDNVDFMLDLDHRGQTVICWSLSPETQARVLEPRTASAAARVEAAAKCQRAGYPVRFRLAPIIPVRNWRDEYAQLIAHIFAVTRPDVISLAIFGWMDLAATERCLDLEVLEPEAVAAMRAPGHDADWPGRHSSPLPFDYRRQMFEFLIAEIRRHSAEAAIAICLDTPRMWAALGTRIGQSPERYFCNCGAHCAPRRPRPTPT